MNAAPYAGGVLAKGSVAYPSLRLSGGGRRRARADPPHRGDRCAPRRSPRRRGAAVLAARQARHVDGVRRHQAGAGQRDSGMGALADSRRRSGRRSRACRSPPTIPRRRASITRPRANIGALREARGRQKKPGASHARTRAPRRGKPGKSASPPRSREDFSVVQNRGDLRIVDVGLVVPVEAGVDDLRQLLALERLHRRIDDAGADADRVLGDRAGIEPERIAPSAPCRNRSRSCTIFLLRFP